MKKNNSSARSRDPDEKNCIKAGSRFTNTAVPRCDGGVVGNSICRSSRLVWVRRVLRLHGR